MPTQTFDIGTRILSINSALTDPAHQQVVDTALQTANGDWTVALARLKDQLPQPALQKVELAHALADMTSDNVPLVRALAEQPSVTTLRDVALNFNADKLAALVQADNLPADIAGATPEERARNFAASVNNKLFMSQTSAVLQRMVTNAEVPIADTNLRTGIASFLNNQPDFNIRTTSIYTALQRPEAFQNIAEDQRAGIVDQLKTLQRVAAISPVPDAVPVLMKANISSAFDVSQMPESTFLKMHGGALGEDTARQVYGNAINAHIRNEHALVTMRETLKGPGLAIMGGQQTQAQRTEAMQKVADKNGVPLNLSTLFGSLDYCECEDCLSVYSPAAYFVELLQFLRNNNLGPDPATGDPDPLHNKNIHSGIVGTPLEKLFRRRPDLGCLELTCVNTFTVLPYIDLVNEVMESFVVHLGDYDKSSPNPATRQATLEAFNVEGETTSELLAIPQHINYQAYCILKSAVYPFTLPYHQPIDATRIFLNYLGTSRWELLDTFRTPTETCAGATLTPTQLQELQALHQAVIDRAVDADFVGMTQEEYIILTREAFWPKRYFDLTQNKTFSVADYEKNIGVRQVCEYYGYVAPAVGSCDADMLRADETAQVGLTFVKKQFLPRTGIQYTDLVELLKTRFINPNFPQGQALTLLESIRFSYRFLQTLLVDSKDKTIRFGKLIDFLNKKQALVPLLDALFHPDPCKQQKPDACIESRDFRDWVFCYFDRIGTLIMLESGEGPRLPIEGQLLDTSVNPPKLIGMLHSNGTIVDSSGTQIGLVDVTGRVMASDGTPLLAKLGIGFLEIRDLANNHIGYVNLDGLNGPRQERLTWLPARDTCDLDKVRLVHLDGSSLTVEEYDRMQRFIRLWRKLGWTIDETDHALTGLASGSGSGAGSGAAAGGSDGGMPTGSLVCEYVGFDTFVDDCVAIDGTGTDCQNDGGKGTVDGCPEMVSIDYTITPAFLHQLRAVKKLLNQTGLPLPKLLSLWAYISTDGEKSLYSKLFLTHNLLGIDKVFKADVNGNYLTQPARITDHLPVLMAALKLKADDIAAMMSFAPVADALTLPNVSLLYRYSLLAKILHIRVPQLADVVVLFGNPFNSAWDTLALLETWGKMEDAGFTFRQLNYLILDHDDPLRPLAPSKKTVLQLAKTLFDGLNAIDRDHADITPENKAEATGDLVRITAALLFDSTVVEKIISLLEGTAVYTTNAPIGLKIAPLDTDTLSKKLKYSEQKNATPPTASIQVTGILTDAEIVSANALSNHPDWPKAIVRVGKQTKNIFNDVLYGIFADTIAAQKILLAGDFNNPSDTQDAANTAPAKRFYFLQVFLPFLREQLAQRLITVTASSAVGMASDVTRLLLTEILQVGTPAVSAMKTLEAIKTKPVGAPVGWQGYLIPSADADYTFVAIGDTQPPALLLNGESIAFTVQQEDPSNVWSSDPLSPTKLKSGKLYSLQVADRPADQLLWKTSTSPSAKIPSSSLLPDFSSTATKTVFTELYKAALLVNGFNLSVDEVGYWQKHATDFDNFDFNAVTLQHWKRLQTYVNLRDSLPRTETSLLDLFKWASQSAADPAKLSAKIAAVTAWKQEAIDKLIAPDANDAKDHFHLDQPSLFRNEINLVKLRQALSVADKIAVDIDRLFDWAKPGSKFWACHQIAEDVRKALRARFDESDWEQVVKPLNDQLRENQKQALISYLLVQPDLIDWGVIDADGLFEFFLIDVQMNACMETSRIKQAISSVQSFIQRCLLGLEERQSGGVEVGVPNDAIDRDRWDWMQRYRVWEANRKVFLYPENWIQPELRDDKSSFYKELESELLQKDINTQTVQDALKSYLFKVDEVANLKVVGLFFEQDTDSNGNLIPSKLHVFGRTRNVPYFFYYRYLQIGENNWYPWEKMQVDIPSYDRETDSGAVIDNGTYLVPIVWLGRLLVFFPQFSKKTTPLTGATVSIKKLADQTPGDIAPGSYWEIKLAWCEYRNGKWTQKQLSPIALTNHFQEISFYQFVPRSYPDPDERVAIDVYFNDQQGSPLESVGRFNFRGSVLTQDGDIPPPLPVISSSFQYISSELHSFQATGDVDPPFFATPPYFDEQVSSVAFDEGSGPPVIFDHFFVHKLLGKLTAGTLDELFQYLRTISDPADKADAYGKYVNSGTTESLYHELKRPYAIYNWELGFHALMELTNRTLKARHFDQALKLIQYILNPSAMTVAGEDPAKRFWQFQPFKETESANVLENLFLRLMPGQPNAAINAWRNKPFQPHVIARDRPAAYMKWVAMTYIRILIDWGDYLFRQDTIESINQATQLYVLAAHTYGPRGQKIPRRGKVLPETYNALLDKWDAFGNAMVELELAFPFSNQTPSPVGVSNGVVGLANVFGFAMTLYFCIPDNPDLTALRDTIDDRLFKIRHCENIAGVFRKLPLFEPPIDPGLLVQAAAQGLSLSSVLNDLNSPMPNYRFYYLLQKALEVCNELKTLGNAFLSAKEKGDNEALSRLRATHERSIHNLVMDVRKLQVEESSKSFDALQQSRKGPVYRMQHHLKLIGEELAKVPGSDSDFSELADTIERPVDESGLKLIGYEKEEMDKAGSAADLQLAAGITETLAGILYAIPLISADVKPIGIGAGVAFGGINLGQLTHAVTEGLKIGAGHLQHQSNSASRKAGFLRQMQDRVQQANAAGYEIKNIDKQALTQQIRINIANQEIINQQKQIDNAQEMDDFLRNKYTNQELYSWMESQARGLYYQAYTLAYDLAKRAEKVFRFERGLTTSDFIQFGYWDPAYDGLLTGERLYMGLKQLEAAYQEKRGYDFEIIKNISLQQINPLELIQLRETGTCEFALPEVLFDMGFPGQYMRRIKSVALTFACHVGPPTSLNCVLRLVEHKFRTSAIVNGTGDYAEHTDETDERFSTVNVPITSIAVSTGQNDSGMFELSFKDERYIPFEGAGVISKWRISLPEKFREFDYASITDVVMHVRYTALDGGDKLKGAATASVQTYVKNVEDLGREDGLFALFDLRHDFPNEWYKASNPPAGATERVIALDGLLDRLPIFTKGTLPAKILASDVYVYTPSTLSGKLKLVQAAVDFPFGDSLGIDNQADGTKMNAFVAKGVDCPLTTWQIKIADINTPVDQLWLVIRYKL